MNKQQRAYALAKARVQALDEQNAENEKNFIIESGYRNPDGSVPEKLYMIDDEEAFERLCNEFDKSGKNLFQEVKIAEKRLRQAEDELIDYALSIVPKSIAEVLDRNRRTWKVRKKLIDAAFRLDTKTVPKP